ncbi:hypothetical protein [Pseudoroseomonas cervicalis]|uniref:hypothetical protein n=1 Tax=Teichococcus cervicalis TaxID=204525 RepID=UPI0022F15503|nr:hypothetical protein [Pseudoroseomonas cervicalis]WBV44082.1 hypothetical protein PFY06_05825 [Pseudoroseomonas cervicalis]
MKLHVIGAATLALALAACGTNERDRVQGGAAAGAATGAGVGALGGPVGAAVGAVVGGGAGAVTGATTSPQDVNLGRPLWRDPEVRTPLDERHRRSSTRRSGTSRANSDGAYMGGGMVVEQGGTPANPAPAGSMGNTSTGSGAGMTGTPATPTNPAPRTTP